MYKLSIRDIFFVDDSEKIKRKNTNIKAEPLVSEIYTQQ